MVIPSNIKLKINVGLNSEFKTELKFFKDIQSIDFENDIVKVKEYHHLSVMNQEKVKLYFDGFDVLEDENLIYDENKNKYLFNGEVTLIDSNNINNILVPGYYLFKVVDEKTYYSIIEIEPKHINGLEWKQLYKEIDKFSNGLSRSLINKTNSKAIQTKNDSNFYEKINYLIENYKQIVHSLNFIKTNPRHKVSKNYNWINKNATALIDKNSIKKHSSSPHMKNYLYSYKRNINYNISENIWLKTKLTSLLKELNSIQSTLKDLKEEKPTFQTNIIRNTRVRNNVYIINKQIMTIKNTIISLLREEWINTLSKSDSIKPNKAALMDYNYNTIFKWVKEFNKTKLDIVFSEIIQNSWKRTDELYEIWCYIQVLLKLIEENYEPIDGWLYSEQPELELYEETIVKLKKDKISLNIHYNSKMKGKSSETSKSHPLYTSNRKNKPDIRIDIFVNHIFLKSIPIDVKYRKLSNITHKDKGSLDQLFAYKDSPSSIYHLEGAKEYKRKNHRIINKVVVLFPKDEKNSHKTNNLKKEYGIEFYELSPNNIEDGFVKMIKNEIQDMIELYEDTYNN